MNSIDISPAPESSTLAITKVTTIDPERTFLDKILILHGMMFYFEVKGGLRGNGRMSRHYYDVHRLMGDPVGEKACTDGALIEDCVRHAQMFFYRPNTGLDAAQRGSFRLRPLEKMLDQLRRDYDAMSTRLLRPDHHRRVPPRRR
jgi:Nucleotidyl transferase AbiEii toxin, Type IV TA system